MPQETELNNLRTIVEESTRSVDLVDAEIKALYPLTAVLKQNPDQEKYAKLVAAIDEIVKTWQVVDAAFAKVFLLFNPKGDLIDALPDLLEIDADQLGATVREGRGHCHRISEIYWTHIKDWGGLVLAPDDQQTLDRVFDRLGNADLDVFRPMEALAAETGSVASNIVALVLADQLDEARQSAKGLYALVTPLRRQITISLSELKRFQSQFAELAPEDDGQPPHVIVNEGGVYVGGDQITIGDIIDSEGVAIGEAAEATVVLDYDAVVISEIDMVVADFAEAPAMVEIEPLEAVAMAEMTAVEPPPPVPMETVASDDGAKGISLPEPVAEESVWQTRRIDLAMPSTATVAETTELRALIALLNSEGLRKHLPDFTEGGAIIRDENVRDDAQVDLQFPADKRPLIIYMRPEPNDDDFEVITKTRRIVLFPDRDSNQLTFLLKPLRALSLAYVPVELYADAACTEPLGSAGTASIQVVTAVSTATRTPQPDTPAPITYVINGGTVTFGDVTTVGNITNSNGIAIGTQATVTITQLFEPLQTAAVALASVETRATVEQQIDLLQREVEKGESADDETMANLIDAIVAAAPTAVATILNLFTNAIIAKTAGAATNFVLKRLRK